MQRVNPQKKEKTYLYKNILLIGSLLSSGNIIEYFSKHTENLIVYYLLKTLRNKKDFIAVYKRGKLIETKEIFTPRISIFYYIFVYCWYIKVLFTYFSKKQKFYIVSYHPLFFIGNKVLKSFRDFEIVFWVIDYLPHPSFLLKIYQLLISYYHKNNTYNIYLGDKVNEVMNGKVINTFSSKTIMWGVEPKHKKKRLTKKIVLAFIGVVRPGHGLEVAFQVLKNNRNIHIKILGECEEGLYRHYMDLIRTHHIEQQVVFGNKFYDARVLEEELEEASIGIGLYSTNKNDPIYYTDPGKIKTYTEFGLPIIMTNTSEIATYVRKFRAGVIVARNAHSVYTAIKEIMKNYTLYTSGVTQFNNFFRTEIYYKGRFSFLETE